MPENEKGIRAGLDNAAFKGQDVSKDQIKQYLKQDLYGVYLVLADLLRTEEAIDALTEVFYKRYHDLKLAKENAPELDLIPRDDVDQS